MSVLRRSSNERRFHSSTKTGEGVALSYIGSQWMTDKFFISPKEFEYLEYEHLTRQDYDVLLHKMGSGIYSSMDAARSSGVHNEWEIYQYWANAGAPHDVFRYVDDNGSIA